MVWTCQWQIFSIHTSLRSKISGNRSICKTEPSNTEHRQQGRCLQLQACNFVRNQQFFDDRRHQQRSSNVIRTNIACSIQIANGIDVTCNVRFRHESFRCVLEMREQVNNWTIGTHVDDCTDRLVVKIFSNRTRSLFNLCWTNFRFSKYSAIWQVHFSKNVLF